MLLNNIPSDIGIGVVGRLKELYCKCTTPSSIPNKKENQKLDVENDLHILLGVLDPNNEQHATLIRKIRTAQEKFNNDNTSVQKKELVALFEEYYTTIPLDAEHKQPHRNKRFFNENFG